jgi:hypothetical protein
MHRAFERRWLTAFCLTLLGTGPLAAQVRVVYDVEAAEELSHKTGKPILTIAGTTN